MSLTNDQILELSRRDAAPWAERAQALAAAQVERQLPLLGELAEIGLEVARAVERAARAWTPPEADAPAPVTPVELPEAELADSDTAIDEAEPRPEAQDGAPPDPRSGIEAVALAYARVSRAVRLTIALQSKLVKDLEDLHGATDKRDRWKARQGDMAAGLDKARRKDAVAQAVLRIAYAETPDQERAERFLKSAYGWMENDRYADLNERPMSEVVAQICKDLRLNPDWPRLAEDAWARAEIATGKPGAPLKALLGRPARQDAPQDGSGDEPDDGLGRLRPWRRLMRPSIRAGPY